MKAINPKWEWEISIINFSWKEKREVWEVIVPKGTFQILKAKTLLNSLYNLKWKQQIWVLNKLKSSHPAFFFFFLFWQVNSIHMNISNLYIYLLTTLQDDECWLPAWGQHSCEEQLWRMYKSLSGWSLRRLLYYDFFFFVNIFLLQWRLIHRNGHFGN